MNAQDIVTGLMKRLDAAEARVKELEAEEFRRHALDAIAATEVRCRDLEAKYIQQLNRANHESAEHRQYAREYQASSVKCDQLQKDIDRLRAFRDAVYAKIREGAGNLTDPFAYIFHREWDAIKAAEEAKEDE